MFAGIKHTARRITAKTDLEVLESFSVQNDPTKDH
jgi:hypothetical protein